MFLMTETGRVIGLKHGVGFTQLDFVPENGPFMCRFDDTPGPISHGTFAGSTLERHDDGCYSLMVAGRYMCAAPAWNVVEFDRKTVGAWETFRAVSEDAFTQASDGLGAVAVADVLWGKCRFVKSDPSVLNVKDCFYLPWSSRESWGVFAADGACLFDAMTEHHFYKVPLETSFCLDSIINEAPETTYIYGGFFNCHFGHFIIDTLSRLWNSETRGSYKLLFHSTEEASLWFEKPFISQVLKSLGIGLGDIATFSEPTRISCLIVPKTSLSAQNYVHKVYGEFCRRLGERLGVSQYANMDRQPVYLSRSRLQSGIRTIINEDELEHYLAEYGVRIVYPESLPFVEQIRMIQKARYIIGVAGSALHMSAFCSPKRIVALSTSRIVNSNYHLIDATSGSNVKYLYPTGIEDADAPFGFTAAHCLEDPRGVARALLSAATAEV